MCFLDGVSSRGMYVNVGTECVGCRDGHRVAFWKNEKQIGSVVL